MVTGALDYLGKISVKKTFKDECLWSGLLVLVEKVSAHNTMTPISEPTNPTL